MLIIRAEQLSAIERARWHAFERRASTYAAAQWPGVSDLRARVEQSLASARTHGMDSEFDLLRFMTISFTLGHAFHSDPRYPWAADVLDSRVYGSHTKMDLLWQLMQAEFGVSHDPDALVDDDEETDTAADGADHDVEFMDEDSPAPEPWSEDPGESPPDIVVDTDAEEHEVK